MISKEKYIPILKCKEGEFIALSKLPDEIKDTIVPISDLVPIPHKKKFEGHIQSSIGYIKKWNKDRLLYIDGYMLQNSSTLVNRKRYMEFIFDELRKTKFNVIPVISNISNLDYLEQVKRIIEKDKRGVCLRIFGRRDVDNNDEIEKMVSRIGLQINQIDLLIDLRSIAELSLLELSNWENKILSSLIYTNNCRSLILGGGNFPIDLTELIPNQIHLIPRKHWLVWKELYRNKDIERYPSYADYGISHPLMSSFEGIPNASASIRYTQEEDYYIYRGRGTRQYHFEQFFDLSESLINSDEFYGIKHCVGDEFIHKCGTVKEKTGSLTTWRWVGTCHHITVLVNQLRQFWRDFNANLTS